MYFVLLFTWCPSSASFFSPMSSFAFFCLLLDFLASFFFFLPSSFLVLLSLFYFFFCTPSVFLPCLMRLSCFSLLPLDFELGTFGGVRVTTFLREGRWRWSSLGLPRRAQVFGSPTPVLGPAERLINHQWWPLRAPARKV